MRYIKTSFKGEDNKRMFNKYKKITEMRMLRVAPAIYDRLTAEVNNPTEEGLCVQECLVKHLTTNKGKQLLSEGTIVKTLNQIRERHAFEYMCGVPSHEGRMEGLGKER